jgi:hypothetical protein
VPAIGWERPEIAWAGLAIVAVALGLAWRRLRRAGCTPRRVAVLTACRATGLVLLVLLLARPVVHPREEPGVRRTVALLVDRSRSMGLAESGGTRHRRAVAYARDRLAPALRRQGFEVPTFLFDAASVAAPLPAAGAETAPAGDRTALGRALHHAMVGAAPAPAAVVALTDGAANESASNEAALLTLLDRGAPFVGIGFGDDAGVPSLTLQRVAAPVQVPARQAFRVSAHLQASGDAIGGFDLLLMRDGRVVQSRRVEPGRGSRYWSESFEVTETAEGVREFTVQVRPPAGVVSSSLRATTAVRVGKDKEFRVLFVQGALTWDFKFIGRALRGDPGIRLTGLSRTSSHSVFRQNVESADELVQGFPRDVAEMAPYRVLVLSDLKPADLTPAQQELIARFCGELGGGVVLIGGASTFDASWQGSRLEQLLPVTFDPERGVTGVDRAFHLRLTDEARRSPVFQVKADGSSARVWDELPTFTHYGRVLAEKPGATVWARHGEDSGPRGPRVLMAVQPYGAGLSAVIALQNLWRWRLAKDSDPATFDRFWQQLLRHLGQAGRQDVAIHFLDQEIRTGVELRAVVEKQPRPEAAATTGADAGERHTVRVRDPRGRVVLEQSARLVPLQPVPIAFQAEAEGMYSVVVAGPSGAVAGSQSLEVRTLDLEMERTGRDMENLRQWAAATGGLALREEECADVEALVSQVRAQVESRRARARAQPFGLGGPVLALLLGGLGSEWALRRRWGLA